MPDFPIRQKNFIVKKVHYDESPRPETARRLGAILSGVRNPFAGGTNLTCKRQWTTLIR